MANDLQRLLDKLEQCEPRERIDLREPILAHGAAAIGALEERVLARSDLAASAAAWLEVLVRRDPATKTPAVAALRRVASSVPEADARYARDVLLRLGVALTPAARPPAGKVSIPRTAGTEWAGFQEHEFGKNDGTKWRSATGRASLAPIVLRRLQALDPDFISFGVDRSPEIHFAVGRRYRANPLTVSKLFVYAHGPTDEDTETPLQAAAGWYIERGDGEAKHGDPDDATTWDWPLFLRALERPEFQQRLSRLMEKHGLRFGDYEGSRYTKALGWSAAIEDGDPVARAGKQVARGWADVLALLQAVPPTEWVDLHLVKTWPANEAIAAGQPFAQGELMPVLLDLAPLYLEMLDPAARTTA